MIEWFESRANDPLLLLVIYCGNLLWFNGRYLLLNGAIYYLGFVRFPALIAERKISPRERLSSQSRLEIAAGLRANLVFAGTGTACHWLIFSGKAPMYLDPAKFGWGYLPLSFLICLVAHDLWFYGTHRALHEIKWLYRHWHSVHHASHIPTPFADLAMHPGEALINGLFFPLILALLPMHPVVWGGFYLMTVLGNLAGHMGAELFPASLYKMRSLRWITFMAFHTFHHSHVHGNYGFYTKIWDKLFRTELPAYRDWFFAPRVIVNQRIGGRQELRKQAS